MSSPRIRHLNCRWRFPRRKLLRCGALLLFAASAGNARTANSSPSPLTEYQVKAAYLFNFTRFVEWPVASTADSSPTFNVCIYGRDPFGNVLDRTIENQKIHDKPVAVQRISHPRDAANCAIIFISDSEQPHISQLLASLPHKGVLTVSDIPGFVTDGGAIEFVDINSRVRFAVNLAAAESSGITMSSELLKVATSVLHQLPPEAASWPK
jgi:hypothetical protein